MKWERIRQNRRIWRKPERHDAPASDDQSRDRRASTDDERDECNLCSFRQAISANRPVEQCGEATIAPAIQLSDESDNADVSRVRSLRKRARYSHAVARWRMDGGARRFGKSTESTRNRRQAGSTPPDVRRTRGWDRCAP
jgi:hypothetical protein